MSNPDPNNAGREEGDARKHRETSRVERRHRVAVRLIQRAFVEHLKAHQYGRTDDIRPVVSLQADAGTACWGAAVLGLALAKLIRRVEFVVSDRPERHGCHIGLWTLAISHADADRWLATHAELHGGTGAEPDDGEAGAPAPNPDASPSPTPFLAHPTLF